MGRQFRTPRRMGAGAAGPGPGAHGSVTQPYNNVVGSSTNVAIPNYGFTDISAWGSTEFVLDAPDTGVRKTIFCGSSTTSARIIHSTTASGGGIAFDLNGSKTMTFTTTVDVICELIGVNSTRWTCMFYPPASTAGTVVLTTT